jgi:Domain of unknown function (DUF1789).
MAIKLNLEPTENLTYKRTVAIPTPDGNPLKVEFTFKHRTRVQVGELFEGYMARAKAAAEKEAEVGPKATMAHCASSRKQQSGGMLTPCSTLRRTGISIFRSTLRTFSGS